jgi:hypothetical protein
VQRQQRRRSTWLGVLLRDINPIEERENRDRSDRHLRAGAKVYCKLCISDEDPYFFDYVDKEGRFDPTYQLEENGRRYKNIVVDGKSHGCLCCRNS